ncbi:uncharacterized protein Gasu_63050 [Galdieria sulphuraria]|uniref:Uncharacterized protein n=1 Tax=Galdieria sulphuraria TaxID=130081 RepID=M2XQY0_GALSU|nr:uncharacterized protein Gasu_63050 [Galdieria sulphuraria]EME26048.1 hypothetical protein Gasu_63050 [Galdieria sulphuraria]|eukprot:XP_005702568.1 hypothetical protein Gasu_63050 [Galdieria sulphuraria]
MDKKSFWFLWIAFLATVSANPAVLLEDNALAESGRKSTVSGFELKGEDVAPNFGLFESSCPGRFGFSIATDSSEKNKSGLVAIGVPGRDAVLILEPKGDTSQGRVFANNWIVDVDLHSEETRSCYQQKEHFGTAVALWGNWIAISSVVKGRIDIYEKSRDGTRWDNKGHIDGTIIEGWNEDSEYGKRLIWFCKEDNLFLLISAPKWSYARHHCGCVFMYKYIIGTNSWKHIQTINPPQEWSVEASVSLSWISFGEAVSLWNDSYFAVGAPGTACWKYKDTIERRKRYCGSVFIYKWEKEKLNYHMEVQPHDMEGGDAFGSSLVSLYPFSLAVGAPRQDCYDGHLAKSSCGAVYLIDGTQDILSARLKNIQRYKPDVQLGSFDLFGFAVEAPENGNFLLVSAPGSWHERGTVFLLKRARGSFAWTEKNLSMSRWLWKESRPFSNLGWQIRLINYGEQYWLLAGAPFARFQEGSVYIVPFLD